MKKLLRSGAYLVVAIALFGALAAGTNTFVCLSDGLDVDGNGRRVSIDRNPNFFISSDPIMHKLLFAPRWINRTTHENINYYGLGANDQYLIFNQTIGLVCLAALFFAAGALINLSEKESLACGAACVFLWLFIIYWAIPALWLIYQWSIGNSLHLTL